MSAIDVRIETLEPMRVASFRAVGASPEPAAWEMLNAWAEPKGLLANLAKHSIYGFCSPPPSPGQEEYGYELWIRIDATPEPVGEITTIHFNGGLYAVTRHRGLPNPEIWRALWDSVKSRPDVEWRKDQEFERSVVLPSQDVEPVFDLLLPVRKSALS